MDIQNQKLTIEGTVTYSRLFDALKGMYEVDDDDSVWEIFNQADDQIEEVVNALKLLSAPPAPVVPDEIHTLTLQAGDSHGYGMGWNACRDEVLRLNAIDNTAQQYEALAGWKMVPVEPTDEMLAAYYDKSIAPISRLSVIGYRAMLEAAPKPEA